MTPRPYQKQLIDGARELLRKFKYIFIMLPTGGGKTIIFSLMTAGAFKRKYRVWIIVPRNELLKQASNHLWKYKVPHGIINAKSNESRAYLVHLVSKSTLTRRWEKIKNWPELIIIDEGHLNYKFQIDLKKRIPEKTRIIGFSATPERLSGEGLSDIYDDIIYGPSIRELVELEFLTKIKYFSPPLLGLDDLHKKGADVDADELAKLFKKRAVYGKAINHYKQHGQENGRNKAAMVFCRSVAASEETAGQFRDAGFKFESIDGKMSHGKREAILKGLEKGEIDGICSCELTIYGIDIPRIEVIIMLRPTFSRTYFMQMIGRGLRPYHGKEFCTILDHVGNLQRHGHPLQDYDWAFHGREKNKKKIGVSIATLKLCPQCFLYYEGDTCPNCGAGRDVRKQPKMEEIDGRLVEITSPVPLNDRDPEEKRDFIDRINGLIDEYNEAAAEGTILPGPVGELLRIAQDLGYATMWVYHRLNQDKEIDKPHPELLDDEGTYKPARIAVNIPLLHEIARQKGHKPGWAYFKKKELQSHNRRAG